jgi:hypothetical protein
MAKKIDKDLEAIRRGECPPRLARDIDRMAARGMSEKPILRIINRTEGRHPTRADILLSVLARQYLKSLNLRRI